jgi:hypothetical protein
MKSRYRCYFTTFHRQYPMVNKDVIFSSNVVASRSNDMFALKCAMCAHAANLSPRFKAWAATSLPSFQDPDYSARFYHEARNYLERPGSEGMTNSSSLISLQATILIALYELRLAHFSQAWVTISRATWLSQLLQLHKLDSPDTSNCPASLPTVQPNLINSDELDGARTTLWAVVTLNCFMGVGVSWNVVDAIDHNEVNSTLWPFNIF